MIIMTLRVEIMDKIQELTYRIDQFIVIEKYLFNMSMMIGLLECLAASYNVPQKRVIRIFNDRIKLIDKDASYLVIDVVFNSTGKENDYA